MKCLKLIFVQEEPELTGWSQLLVDGEERGGFLFPVDWGAQSQPWQSHHPSSESHEGFIESCGSGNIKIPAVQESEGITARIFRNSQDLQQSLDENKPIYFNITKGVSTCCSVRKIIQHRSCSPSHLQDNWSYPAIHLLKFSFSSWKLQSVLLIPHRRVWIGQTQLPYPNNTQIFAFFVSSLKKTFILIAAAVSPWSTALWNAPCWDT